MNLSACATTTDLSQYLKAACGSIRLACPCFTSRSAEPRSYIQFYLHATHQDFLLPLTMATVRISKISLSPPPFDPQTAHSTLPVLQKESSSSTAVLLIFIGKCWYSNSDFLQDFPSRSCSRSTVVRGHIQPGEQKCTNFLPWFNPNRMLIHTHTHTHALNFARQEEGAMVDQEISPQHSIWLGEKNWCFG